jgi:hypothetical protein
VLGLVGRPAADAGRRSRRADKTFLVPRAELVRVSQPLAKGATLVEFRARVCEPLFRHCGPGSRRVK